MARVMAVCRALARGVRDWLGADVCVLAYAGTAAGLYRESEAQLFGLLAALVVGIVWYASPARTWEAARRRQAGHS